MALRRKGSAPWSLTKDTGLSDAPVSGSPFVEGDEVKPVIDAGFIDASGLWQISPSDDIAFTFQDPEQALAAGADMEFTINMLKHDIMILALLDTSGNNINIDILGLNATTLTGPYAPFSNVGSSGESWTLNNAPSGTTATAGLLQYLLRDTDEDLTANWKFYKMFRLRGTQIQMRIHNNEGADTGTISTAYMRLV